MRDYPITPPDFAVMKKIEKNWDSIAKPLNGLGVFEDLISRIGSVQKSTDVKIDKRCVAVMCADNGIVEEGVSQSGQDVTYQVASLMGEQRSSVCHMAVTCRADVIPMDIGMASEKTPPNVRDIRVARGTKNFLKEPAMTDEQCSKAIDAGMKTVRDLKRQGYDIICTGEMGIGNTTTAAAVCALLLGLGAADACGRGAGLGAAGLGKKEAVVEAAISRYAGSSPYEVLRCCGGLDIAGLCGMFIGAATYKVPIVIDGAISAAAALCAEKIAPGSVDYMIPSHLGRETVCSEVMGHLGLWLLTPINGDMALGEGTGAVMLLPLLDAALELYRNGIRFAQTGIEQYRHFD